MYSYEEIIFCGKNQYKIRNVYLEYYHYNNSVKRK